MSGGSGGNNTTADTNDMGNNPLSANVHQPYASPYTGNTNNFPALGRSPALEQSAGVGIPSQGYMQQGVGTVLRPGYSGPGV